MIEGLSDQPQAQSSVGRPPAPQLNLSAGENVGGRVHRPIMTGSDQARKPDIPGSPAHPDAFAVIKGVYRAGKYEKPPGCGAGCQRYLLDAYIA